MYHYFKNLDFYNFNDIIREDIFYLNETILNGTQQIKENVKKSIKYPFSSLFKKKEQ